MSEWEEQNQEVWEQVVFGLAHRSRPTVAWITCDSYRHLRKLVEEFKQRFAEARHFEHRVTDFKENSFPPYFRNHLPAEAFDGSEKRSFVHLFGLELHVGMGNAQPPSRLFEALNFEREVVFGDFPFTTVIWSDTSSQIKAQSLAPDFWDWITEKFHFEAPLDLIEGQVKLMEAPKQFVSPEKRDELYHQIARHLQLLDHTERPLDRLSLLEVIADNYQALQDFDKAIHYHGKVLEGGDLLSDNARARHLNQQGGAFYSIGEYESALKNYELSLRIYLEIGDRAGECMMLNNISQIHHAKGDYPTALDYLERILKIQQDIGDRAGEGVTLNNISQIYHAQMDYDTALDYLERSLKIRQEIGDHAGEGTTLNNIGLICKAQGDYVGALYYLERCLKIRQEIGDRAGKGVTLNNISQVHKAQGDHNTALGYLERSLKLQQEIGDIAGIAATLHNLGAICFERADYAEAVPFFLKAHSIFTQIGSPNAKRSEEYLSTIQEKIGQTRYQEILKTREEEQQSKP